MFVKKHIFDKFVTFKCEYSGEWGLNLTSGVIPQAEYEGGLQTGHVYGELTDDVSLHEDIPDPDACHQDQEEMVNIAITAAGLDSTNRSEMFLLIILKSNFVTYIMIRQVVV